MNLYVFLMLMSCCVASLCWLILMETALNFSLIPTLLLQSACIIVVCFQSMKKHSSAVTEHTQIKRPCGHTQHAKCVFHYLNYTPGAFNNFTAIFQDYKKVDLQFKSFKLNTTYPETLVVLKVNTVYNTYKWYGLKIEVNKLGDLTLCFMLI